MSVRRVAWHVNAMVSFKFSVVFWGLLVLVAQFHSGYSLFLGIKKELIKHKLYKLKEALSDHGGYEEVHHVYYKPYYVSGGYSKWPSYSSYGSYGSYPYKGWSY